LGKRNKTKENKQTKNPQGSSALYIHLRVSKCDEAFMAKVFALFQFLEVPGIEN
jgi:hypothetical protein